MTRNLFPYLLLGIDVVILAGGVTLVAHAVKTWIGERNLD